MSTADRPFVSVVISTESRSASLRRTLESLFSSGNLECRDWEALVVIDFAGGDGSAEVCHEFQRRFNGKFRLLAQNRKGKSNALNFGIAHARGEVLAMTDDDVVCAPDYIRGVQDVFARYPVAAAQGRTMLDCGGELPRWVFPGAAKFMSLCDYGSEVKDWNHTLFGTNMAVRAEAARAVGGFSPELGPGAAGFAEDTEFSFRLIGAGYRFIYAPQIMVRHQVPRSRLTKAFFRKRYFGLGRSQALYAPLEVPVWRFGIYVGKTLLLEEAAAVWNRCAGQPGKAFERECKALEQAGYFWQHWHFRGRLPQQLSRVSSWSPTGNVQPS
jgi:glucosyl-dolichyl phosphate glucuronosyltransferase